MNCLFQRREEVRLKTGEYAMPADFCRVFVNRLDHFYTLALLLTADHALADQCFVSGLEDCLQGNPVFREWTQAWAKRSVIKNAVRSIFPSRSKTQSGTAAHGLASRLSEASAPFVAIMNLPPFSRFAYVLSVLEKYSDRECAVLLDCTVGQVVHARTEALQRLVSMGGSHVPAATALPPVQERWNQFYGEVL